MYQRTLQSVLESVYELVGSRSSGRGIEDTRTIPGLVVFDLGAFVHSLCNGPIPSNDGMPVQHLNTMATMLGIQDHRFAHFVCRGILKAKKPGPFNASFKLFGDNQETQMKH